MPPTVQSWTDAQQRYDQDTKQQLAAIQQYFGSQGQDSPSDLIAADEQFMDCVDNLYNALPKSARTASQHSQSQQGSKSTTPSSSSGLSA